MELPIQLEPVLALQHLPWIHHDPVVRLPVAQSVRERLQRLTADCTLLGDGDRVQWVG